MCSVILFETALTVSPVTSVSSPLDMLAHSIIADRVKLHVKCSKVRQTVTDIPSYLYMDTEQVGKSALGHTNEDDEIEAPLGKV